MRSACKRLGKLGYANGETMGQLSSIIKSLDAKTQSGEGWESGLEGDEVSG